MSRRRNFHEGFLNSLDEIIDANFDKERFGISELAHAMGMSRSNLHRKVKAITKKTSNQYLNSYRLKKGMELLENSSDTIGSIITQLARIANQTKNLAWRVRCEKHCCTNVWITMLSFVVFVPGNARLIPESWAAAEYGRTGRVHYVRRILG